jgi:uncharacterized membrane protein
MAENDSTQPGVSEILGAVVGGGLAFLLTSLLPGRTAAIVCGAAAVVLSASRSRRTHPALWWGGVGAIAGTIIGTSLSLDALLAAEAADRRATTRYLGTAILAVSGFLSGIFIGKDADHPDLPKPAEFLKQASALTVVLYAVVVTASFPTKGLDSATVIVTATATYVFLYLSRRADLRTYDDYRQRVGRGMLLGLEILVAADVIRTVALEPTLQNVLILGLLVVIRTFLSWTLVLEIEERWPWQRARKAAGEGQTP